MYRLLPLFLLFLCTCAPARRGEQPVRNVRLVSESLVAPNGLYFTGEKGKDYHFGRRITPHGDCIDVVNGFVFLTWWRGPMSDRRLMLSRRRAGDEDGPWVTIEFPQQHVGYRGDPAQGDSHNTAAVGVSEEDGTVHLIYDLHAYRRSEFPEDYFNYSISRPAVAFAPDTAFHLGNFRPKAHFLNPTEDYERKTYPAFHRDPAGRLWTRFREGGSGNGDMMLAYYTDGKWSRNLTYSVGRLDSDERYSLYGSEQFRHGRLHLGFSIRNYRDKRFTNNNGFYYAYAEAPFGTDNFHDVNGKPVSMPFAEPHHLQIGAPSVEYGTTAAPKSNTGPSWAVTAAGAVHFVSRVDDTRVHYWRAAGDTTFRHASGGTIPDARSALFDYGEQIIAVDLDEGRPVIQMTAAGSNDWRTVFRDEGRRLEHFNARLEGNRIYLYGMAATGEDARPLYLRTYELSPR